MFFVLSGFLITRILVQMDKHSSIKETLEKFYIRRVLRIFPVYYLAISVLYFWGKLPNALWHYTYLYNVKVFLQGHYDGAVSPFWTLCVEEQFYILYPLFLLSLKPSMRASGVFLLILASAATGICCQIFLPESKAYNLLPVCGQYLLWGGIAGLYEISGKNLGLSVKNLFGLGLIGSLICITLCSAFPGIRNLLIAPNAISFAIMVIAIWRLECFGNLFAPVDNSVTRYLGKISYGLYLFHGPVLAYLPVFLGTQPNPYLLLANSLVLTIAISIASWHFFEKPINSLKDILAPRKNTTKVQKIPDNSPVFS